MPLPASALSTPRHRKGVGEWPARKRCTQAHACILHANAAARRSSAPHPGRGCDKQLDPRMPWHATALASPLTAPAPHGLGNGRRDEGHACMQQGPGGDLRGAALGYACSTQEHTCRPTPQQCTQRASGQTPAQRPLSERGSRRTENSKARSPHDRW